MSDEPGEDSAPPGQEGNAHTGPSASSSLAAESHPDDSSQGFNDERDEAAAESSAPASSEPSHSVSMPAVLEAARRAAERAQLQPAVLEAARRAAQRAQLQPTVLEAARQAAQQAQLQPAVLEAARRAAQQAQLQPAVLEAVRRAAEQAQLQPAALEVVRRIVALQASQRCIARGTTLVALAQAAATSRTQRPVADSVRSLAESPQFAAWREATAQALDIEGTGSEDATRHEHEAEQTARDLADSPALAAATSRVIPEDEFVSTAIHLVAAAVELNGDAGSTAEITSEDGENALSADELEVLRTFILLFGGAHLTALLVIVATVTGAGIIVVLSTLAAVASLSGYSLRDLLRQKD